MSRLLSPFAGALSVVLVTSAFHATPARADTQPAQPVRAALKSFSPDSIRATKTPPLWTASRAQTTSDKSFFKTPKGAVALGLMIGGAAFTVWSINHDRKPVKSPVR